MDRELLIANISRYALKQGESPSGACIASGLSKNFVSEIKRGRMPNVASIASLAVHFDVSVSDLIGDARTPAELAPLAAAWDELNDEGRERLVQYAEDLTSSGRYAKKSDPAGMDQEGMIG